jgi:hypothetical protein
VGALAVLATAFALVVSVGSAKAQTCPGDCNHDGMVLVNELIICVNIALESQPVTACPECDLNGDGMVLINELIASVNVALTGMCPTGDTPTPTEPGEVPTPTATETSGEPCPLDPGRYTITQGQGGVLRVSTFAEFPFPAGGTLVQEVQPAFEPDCVHSVVVPFPGGFQSPTFCIPALGFTTSVTQTGCGVGRIDSNGGSDFTVLERGDTSFSGPGCDIRQAECPLTGPAPDSSILVRIDVGDGTPDTCASGGTGNALVVVPVFTKTWLEVDEGSICPGAAFNENADMLIVQFPQNLDFTTDTNTARFENLDGDGGDTCFRSGLGPTALPPRTGRCMDLTARTVTTAASGVLGSSGGPTYDLSFTTLLPNTYNPPEPLTNATCANPPAINFEGDGVADRCIVAE